MNPVIRSLLLTFSVCTIISVIAYTLEYNYIAAFLFTFVIQIAVGFIVSSIRDSWLAIKSEQIENDRIALLSQQGLELKCAHCSNSSFVPIRLDEHNNYDCPHCTKSNAVYLNVTVARETAMMNVGRLTTNSMDGESVTLQKIREES